MFNKFLKLIVVASLGSFIFMTPTEVVVQECDAWEGYHNCTETAYQNYEDGYIDGDLLVKFYDDYCKDAAASC